MNVNVNGYVAFVFIDVLDSNGVHKGFYSVEHITINVSRT